MHFYRQPLPRNIHRVTGLTEKYSWGVNLVIGYRSATEKYSQTIILVIILAATVSEFHLRELLGPGGPNKGMVLEARLLPSRS